jgi:signal transduction histidine kinase
MAHDYGNRLQIAYSALNLIRESATGGQTADLPSLIESAQVCLLKARDLVRDVSTVGCQFYRRAEVLDLNEVLDSLKPILVSVCDSAIDLRVRTAKRPIRVVCNANLLENAVINLALNACEAIAASGRITVGVTRATELAGEPGAPDIAHAVITVSDTGRGMPSEILRRAFSPYFTTKPVNVGSGLGLTMTRLFAESMGGRVEAQSIVGRGTSISLLLPEVPSLRVSRIGRNPSNPKEQQS